MSTMGSMTKHSVNLKIQIRILQLLLAFPLTGLLLLCAFYFTLVYYRLVSVAKANLTMWLDSFGTSCRLKPKTDEGYLAER
jgi:hypothetical protein